MVNSRKPLTSFSLKLIAYSCMLADHIGHMFAEFIPYDLYIVIRLVGRVAMPLFCFMCAEGAVKTKNFKKYALRMFVFAVVSEIPFNLLTDGCSEIMNPESQNVLWTLIAGILSVRLIDFCRKKGNLFFVCALIGCPAVLGLVCHFARTDYELLGVLLIVAFYLFRNNTVLLTLSAAVLLCPFYMFYFRDVSFVLAGITFPVPLESFGVLACVPVALYDGERGYYNKAVKYAFYAFYPVHISLIALCYAVFCR